MSHSYGNEAGVSKVVPIDVMKTKTGSRGAAPLILILSIRWTWVAKLHDPAAFPRFLLNRRLDGPELVSRFGGEKNLLSLPGYKPRTVELLAQSLY
jgi:hypothetical protein